MFVTTLNCVYLSFSFTFSTVYSVISLIHAVLPFGLDIGLIGVAAYYLTRLRKPNLDSATSIFGPEPRTKDGEENPEKVARCIAHRGAGLDAPENTMEAFKYCVDHDCKFVELDVRACKDGRLVLLHDPGLERLADSRITDVNVMDWEMIKDINIGTSHPNRHKFKEVHLCLLDEAVDYLLANKVKMIIDIKGDDQLVIGGVLKLFANCPILYKYAAVTCFNPFTLYQIRRSDPEIVGALSYRPFCFSAVDYDAEDGPNTPRYAENLPVHAVLRVVDSFHAYTWRLSAKWCNVSAVLLHKDIVSPSEVQYWRRLGVRCCGWCVNRPVEKLYWRGVLRAPYLANTLMGEADLTTVLANTDAPLDDKIKEVIQTSFATPAAKALAASETPAEPETAEKVPEVIKVSATESAETVDKKRENSTARNTGL